MVIIVIGGGFAGAAAACRLAGDGHPPILLERAGRLGGRAGSFYLPRRDEEIDYGQHVTMRCCTVFQGFLQRIGATSVLRFQRELSIPILHLGRISRLSSSLLPGPLHLAPSLLSYRPLPLRDRLAGLRAGLSLLLDRRRDEMTFADWLDDHGQEGLAVDRLWDPICIATLNARSSRVGLSAARTVLRVGLFRPGAADIGLFVRPFSQVFSAARRYIEKRGGTVRVSSPVRSVLIEGGRISGIETADGEAIEADAVIAAVPPDELGRILPEGAIDLPAFSFSPIVDLHLWFDRPVMDEEFVIPVGSPVGPVFDLSKTRGDGPLTHIVVSQSAADDWIDRPVDEIAERLVSSLRDLLPAVRQAVLVDRLALKHREATFIPVPGIDWIRPSAKTPIAGLYLAGDWTATGWPATIEGAVRSGIVAAARLEGEL